jgi:sugar-specific transcriptional regulator TrmB
MQLESLIAGLRNLGLSEKQAKVYAANLFLGPASAQKIAEQAGINRPTAYDILEELARLGLVSRSSDNGRSVFVSGGVEGIQDWLQRQAEEVQQRAQRFEELAPELRQMSRGSTGEAPAVRFVHGKEGVDAIWPYVIRKATVGEEVLSVTNHDRTLAVYPDHLQKNPTVRLSKKLSSKQFYYNSKQQVASDPAILKETKRLAEPAAADITLYQDKAVLLSYGSAADTTAADWTGIVIESKDIVAVLRQLFYLAWNNNKED